MFSITTVLTSQKRHRTRLTIFFYFVKRKILLFLMMHQRVVSRSLARVLKETTRLPSHRNK